MLRFLQTLDRRWIFLLMALAVGVPTLFQVQFPEVPTALTQAAFDEIDALSPGDRVLLAFDYDPASEGELGPMATAFIRQCCEKRLKMYFVTLWPVGPQLINDAIQNVIKADFSDLIYGEDYVNLGFKPGEEGVIKVIVTNLRGLYTTDALGTNIDQIPMCRNVRTIRAMDLIINVSGGYPGTKEWIQYAVTPYSKDLKIVAGCTGVQAPYLYPYIPQQMPGMLAAIKGAAEYETLVEQAYGGAERDPKYFEGARRMGPQLFAHLLMIGLILAGNAIYLAGRRQTGGGR
jgi:hypothetical protein